MSSSSSKRSIYEVFLSFRGEDTRQNITGHLYMALKNAGVNVFIDDNELRRGEDITAELVRAIRGSRISVIVFSRGYADSGWCLEELVKIMGCRETLGQIVLPIFYHIDPSHVRKQTDTFAEAFQKHEDRFHKKDHKVERWRAALTQASNLSGWDLRNGHEAKFIREITNEITRHLNNTYLHVASYQVGIRSRVKDISCYLGVGSDDVRIIGITGMSGLGKTTVAKAVYNQFYDRFEGRSFLENVREKQLVGLQNQLLSDILKPTKIKVNSVSYGISVIGKRLGSLRVLVIIDNIDHADQLEALAINRDSFGSGSRIIITSSDEHLLNRLKVDKIYRVPAMNEEEALELLSWHAFENFCPNKEYMKIARDVVGYCGGLPLALQVLGSFLCGRSIGQWQSTLVKLKKIPHEEIQKRLMISYDGLSDDYERDIFCDVSCFFIGMDKNYCIQILDGCGFSAEIGMEVLIERCLVTVDERNKLMMHDFLRDMGREVVRKESPKYLGKRSRLWQAEDVKDVLINKSGSEEIEGLTLDLLCHEDSTSFSTEAFKNMKRLRLLRLNYVQLSGGYECLSKNLRWLCWRGFPLEFIPKDMCQPNIVAIDMRYSSLIQVFCNDAKVLQTLTILNLSHSHDLTQSPDFSKLPNLEKLILKDCKNLSEVHKSVGDLKSLVSVNLKDCQTLECLPEIFYRLTSVETLVLNGCSRFKMLGKNLGKMLSLTTLLVDETAITKVPPSLARLKKLQCLSLCNLNLKSTLQLRLPSSLRGLCCLTELFLSGCNLKHLPEDIGSLVSLETLYLDNNSFDSLPNLSGLSKLYQLSLENCNLSDDAIESVNLGSLSSLVWLYLSKNKFCILPSLSSLSKLGLLQLISCTNLREIKDIPSKLAFLEASYCNALEKMPNMSEKPGAPMVLIDHSPKLIEFPGLDTALNLGMQLRMQQRNKITDVILHDSMLQGWNGAGEICVGGSDIPEWFNHAQGVYQVHFEVPREMDLKALALCIVYYSCYVNLYDDYEDFHLSIFVINDTKHVSFEVILKYFPRTLCGEYIWPVLLLNSELNLEGGDSIHVFSPLPGDDDYFFVHKMGIRLLCDGMFVGSSNCMYRSIPYIWPVIDAINSDDQDDDDDEDDNDEDDNDSDDDNNEDDNDSDDDDDKR